MSGSPEQERKWCQWMSAVSIILDRKEGTSPPHHGATSFVPAPLGRAVSSAAERMPSSQAVRAEESRGKYLLQGENKRCMFETLFPLTSAPWGSEPSSETMNLRSYKKASPRMKGEEAWKGLLPKTL